MLPPTTVNRTEFPCFRIWVRESVLSVPLQKTKAGSVMAENSVRPCWGQKTRLTWLP